MRSRTILALLISPFLAACATSPLTLENGSSPRVDLTLCYKWGDVRTGGADGTQSYFLGPDGSPVFAAMSNVTGQRVPASCDVLADFNAGTVISSRTGRLLLNVPGGAASASFGGVASQLYRALAPGTDLYKSIVAERRPEPRIEDDENRAAEPTTEERGKTAPWWATPGKQ